MNYNLILICPYKLGANGIPLWYVLEHERPTILMEAHEGVVQRNFARKSTMQKKLHAGLWWPTIHRKAKKFFRSCDSCQRVGKHSWWYEMSLHPQLNLYTFEMWVVDFIGLIVLPVKRSGAWYIITMMDYFTRWSKATPFKDFRVDTIAKFLFENFLTHFGCPKILMSDQGTNFLNWTIETVT